MSDTYWGKGFEEGEEVTGGPTFQWIQEWFDRSKERETVDSSGRLNQGYHGRRKPVCFAVDRLQATGSYPVKARRRG